MRFWSDDWQKNFQAWYESPYVPSELKNPQNLFSKPISLQLEKELRAYHFDQLSAEMLHQLEDRFRHIPHHGPSGLRGKMEIGLNRLNTYTVAIIAQSIADFLRQKYTSQLCFSRGYLIGYDNRHPSRLFAQVIACVLAANGISIFLFPDYVPTPLLAYGIRHQNALGGIIITASHSPKTDNGIRLYDEDGLQQSQNEARLIHTQVRDFYNAMDYETAIQEHFIHFLPQDVQLDYIQHVHGLLPDPLQPQQLKIAYTPLHGTGEKLVLPLLQEKGFTQLFAVPEQILPNGTFPTVKSPNLEYKAALRLLKRTAEKHKADVAIANDPDADRLAILVPDGEGAYMRLSGNVLGAILAKYWIEQLQNNGQLGKNATIVKSIVTNNLGAKVATESGVMVIEALTGFKDIASYIRLFQNTRSNQYIMGYEESDGFAFGDRLLDKDGCATAYILAHAAAYYKAQNKSLWQVLQEIEAKFGHHLSKTLTFKFDLIHAHGIRHYIMEQFRLHVPLEMNNLPLTWFEDYRSSTAGEISLNGQTRTVSVSSCLTVHPGNVLRFHFTDKCWIAVRPSGTDPALKIYLNTQSKNLDEAKAHLEELEEFWTKVCRNFEQEFYRQLERKKLEHELEPSHLDYSI